MRVMDRGAAPPPDTRERKDMTQTRIDRIALAVTAILGLGLSQTAMAETELDVVVKRFVATGMARSNDY